MKGHKTAVAEFKGVKFCTSSWVHAHIDGSHEATHKLSLSVGGADSHAEVSVYVDESDIDAMIATLREFKRNAVLTNREFAVAQNRAA